MKKVKIVDQMFAHATFSTDFQKSKYIEWDRKNDLNDNDIVFFTDYSVGSVSQGIRGYAWLLESPQITKQSHSWIALNNTKFEKVLTHNKILLDKGENYCFSPTGGCWIKPSDQKVYDKTKLISMISSNKNITTGHLIRHEIMAIAYQQMDNNHQQIDLFGRNINPINYKLSALKDYAFSITIENAKEDYYFSEKLIDCFRTGTVLVYWGYPSIGDFFDLDGIVVIDSAKEIDDIIDKLTIYKYNSMLPAIHRNFDKAQKFIIAEDYIYENYLK